MWEQRSLQSEEWKRDKTPEKMCGLNLKAFSGDTVIIASRETHQKKLDHMMPLERHHMGEIQRPAGAGRSPVPMRQCFRADCDCN